MFPFNRFDTLCICIYFLLGCFPPFYHHIQFEKIFLHSCEFLFHLHWTLHCGIIVSINTLKNQEIKRIRLIIFYIFLIANKCHEKTKTNNELNLLTSIASVAKAWYSVSMCHRVPLCQTGLRSRFSEAICKLPCIHSRMTVWGEMAFLCCCCFHLIADAYKIYIV